MSETYVANPSVEASEIPLFFALKFHDIVRQKNYIRPREKEGEAGFAL